jgi:hypothetical protein
MVSGRCNSNTTILEDGAPKTAVISARIDPGLKDAAEEVFN